MINALALMIQGYIISNIFDDPKITLDFKNNHYIYVGKNNRDNTTDIIDLNQDIYDWLYEHRFNISDIGNGSIIKVINISDGFSINIHPNIPKDAKVWYFNSNIFAPNNITDLENNYAKPIKY